MTQRGNCPAACSPDAARRREQQTPRRWRLWLLLLVVALGGSLLAPGAAAAQEASPEAEEAEPWSGPREREQVGRSAHFDVWVPTGSPLAARGEEVAAAAERVLPSVEARLGTPLAERVTVLVLPAELAPTACPARAAAIPHRRRIIVFDWPETREPAARDAFLAHEIGHQLTLDRWGVLGPDPVLSEGLATWAAEPWWLAWQGWPTIDAAVADFLRGAALTELEAPRKRCLPAAERNIYYSAWASFVDYLQREYGWEAVGQALRLPPADDRADYQSAFGASFAALVADWTRAVRGAAR